MSSIIGVYNALYAYQPQTDQELDIEPGDLLYVIEKSQTDDWWKVKKKVGEDEEEPLGLVPSTYLEPATPVAGVKALYDYERQTDEELSLTESQTLNVYDNSDPDWLLVGDGVSMFGFVPANYVETTPLPGNGTTGPPEPPALPPQQPTAVPQQEYNAPAATAAAAPPQQTFMNFAPPPPTNFAKTRYDRSRENSVAQPAEDNGNNISDEDEETGRNQEFFDADDEPTPRLPRRPSEPLEQQSPQRSKRESSSKKDEPFYTWAGQEVDGKGKKHKCTLAVGNDSIILSPDKKSSQEWPTANLVYYSIEKKHIFMDMKHPTSSIDFLVDSKSTAEDIIHVLGQVSGASKAVGIKEVLAAAVSGGQKIGRVIYSFHAQGEDELSVKENEDVYILDDKQSPDWWRVKKVLSGQAGVVPSSYIEVVKKEQSSGGGSSAASRARDFMPKIFGGSSSKHSKKDSTSSRRSSMSRRASRADIDEDENGEAEYYSSRNTRTRSQSRARRDDDGDLDRQSSSRRAQSRSRREQSPDNGNHSRNSRRAQENPKTKPDPSRVRTWTDRSGTFKVDAALLGCVDGKIHLHKINGVKIAVSCSKMSVGDLEYVEEAEHTDLDEYKPQSERRKFKELTASAKAKQDANKFDWFEFFLSCGVDVNNCQRYASNFDRDKMDDSILPDITPSIMRTLGLKEGDILRVNKVIDEKYRKKDASSTSAGGEAENGGGSLFTSADGTLKNNTSKRPRSATNASFEDNAWDTTKPALQNVAAAKPAAATSSSSPTKSLTPQITGSNKNLPSVPATQQRQNLMDLVTMAPLQPSKTGPMQPPQQPQQVQMPPLQRQMTQQMPPIQQPQYTGATVQPQYTGAPAPIQPQPQYTQPISNGVMPAMQQQPMNTGYLSSNPTGMSAGSNQGMSMNGLALQLQQQKISSPPLPTPNLGPFATGNASLVGPGPIPFNQAFQPQQQQQQPQQSFQMSPPAPPPPRPVQQQMYPPQQTGYANNMIQPQQQPQPQLTGFGNQPAAAPPPLQRVPTGFGQQQQVQRAPTGFGQPSPIPNQQTGYGNMQAPPLQRAVSGFGQPMQAPSPQTGFGMQPTGFAAAPQPTGFVPQPLASQPTGYGFQIAPTENITLGAFDTQRTGFNGFGGGGVQQQQQQQQQQPLQPQRTGPAPNVQFGVKPLQPTPTGNRHANLSSATPDNPFGF